jgi:hypothetical protein
MYPNSRAILQADQPNFVGDEVMIYVRSMLSTSPPRVLVRVSPPEGGAHEHELSLGDTFPIEGETWRFDDIEIFNPDRWHVIVQRVEPGSPPYTVPPLTGRRVWNEVELRPFGTLDEEQLTDLERDLGRKLPRFYRRWLADNNGAAPIQDVGILGGKFTLDPSHPLLGMRPDEPLLDLRHAEEHHRKPCLTDAYTVIAVPAEGLIVVSNRSFEQESIHFLPTPEAEIQLSPEYPTIVDFLSARRLIYLTDNIYSFCGYLQPVAPSDAIPNTPR